MHPAASLAEHTTLRVGGPAESFLVAESDQEIVEAVRECDDAGVPVLVLGGGSNLVVADAGFSGSVVEARTRGITVDAADDTVELTLAAGEPWEEAVALAVSSGWSGIEALSGIPGRAGATPIQNVGAYGQEVANVITAVDGFDRDTGEVVRLDPAACGFGYRTSAFKEDPDRWLVLAVTMRLQKSRSGVVRYGDLARILGIDAGTSADLAAIRDGVIELRRAKGMVLDSADHDTWSAGSFFTNPIVPTDEDVPGECPRYPAVSGVKLSAAWLIEHSGIAKGFALAPDATAAISSKHTLALTNRGGATAADIMALARAVQARVRMTFGIDLAIEPTLVGEPG